MYEYKITLDRVVDGDTIDAYIDLGFDIKTKKRIRFVGINTPECRTRDKEEKQKGLAAKARLIEVLENAKEIHLDSHGVGKFGRVLGQLYVDNDQSVSMVNVNDLLINEGHAVEYHGGKR
jgi:micrococcal nuclease